MARWDFLRLFREPADPDRQTPWAATGEAPNAARWVRNLLIAAAAGVFLALSGAMDTGDAPLWARLAYWIPGMIVGALVGHLTAHAVARIPRAASSRWLFGALLSVAISIPLTLLIWAYTNLMFGAGVSEANLPTLFGDVLLISAAMTAIMIGLDWPGRVTHAASGAPSPPARLVERLPAKLRGATIYAVSAEDHYLRLHTSKGSDLILMRLGDAISELDGLEGAQTHRSWWVAREAVVSARREGDKVVLTLKDGIEAPVSRPNVRPLRQAGWY